MTQGFEWNARHSGRGNSPGRNGGFSLIELMIVVAIMAILTIWAISAYDGSVRKTRRGAAQGCLTERALFMERYYATNMRYDQTNPPVGAPVALTDAALPTCTTDVTQYYTLVPNTFTQTGFTLQAIAKGAQLKDSACLTMTLNQLGVKSPAAGCW